MTQVRAIDPLTRRLLRRLSTPGAWLARPEPESAPGQHGTEALDPTFRLMSGKGARTNIVVPQALVRGAAEQGWISQGEERITLTQAGARSLRQALSGGHAAMRRRPGASVSAAGQSRSESRGDASKVARIEPTAESPGLNEAESPLGWLRRRKDKHGEPLISDEQFAAGERLRADVFFAGLSPRTTMDWGRSGGSAPSRRSAPGGSAQMLDGMIAARERVTQAMRAVGPELSGILMDVCGFMKGLPDIEVEQGWPARSARLILLMALSRLATHYGLTKPGGTTRHGPGKTRHWGADGYRPGLADWEISQAAARPSQPASKTTH